MTERVLCVDDEPNILEAFRRQLRKKFELYTAQGPEQGLEALKAHSPFAVVVSDLKMPGMNGIEFLCRVKESHPDTVRVMLTGFADLNAAIEAVNEGNIFRFLTKPCPPSRLERTLKDCITQYRLITAEKELLEKTLAGSVKVLVDILGLVNPVAFGRASRMKRLVSRMTKRLKLDKGWQYEIAALLSQVGCVTLPPETLEKVYAGQELSGKEEEMFNKHPSVGASLLSKIPRLEEVAKIIEYQQANPDDLGSLKGTPICIGAQMLKIAQELDKKMVQGLSPAEAIEELKKQKGKFPQKLLEALEGIKLCETGSVIKSVTINELKTFMILDEDVKARNGLLLVPKGQEVTLAVIEKLRSFASGLGIVEPIRVRIPVEEEEVGAPLGSRSG